MPISRQKQEIKINKKNNITFGTIFFIFFSHSFFLLYIKEHRVLLPGAPDRAYLINKLIRQREQIVHLRLYFSPLRWYYTGRKKSL